MGRKGERVMSRPPRKGRKMSWSAKKMTTILILKKTWEFWLPKGVKLSAADLTVDQSMAKSVFKDYPIETEAFPEQAGETPEGIN